MSLTPSKKKARDVFLSTGNASEAARAAGVNRSTVTRWIKDDAEFLAGEAPSVPDGPGLASLTPKALKLLDQALDGGKVSASQIRAALEVVKASNVLKAPQGNEESAKSLADIIATLDAEGDVDDD